MVDLVRTLHVLKLETTNVYFFPFLSECKTTSGYPSGADCIFPFKAFGNTFYGCTYDVKSEYPFYKSKKTWAWCSTSNHANGTFKDMHWGTCEAKCQKDGKLISF